MKISIITLFPDMIQGFTNQSIIKRALEKESVEIEIVNLRDFAIDSYGTVDDRPYGGGAGMVLRVDVVKKALDSVLLKNTSAHFQKDNIKTLLTSAKGKPYNQRKAEEFANLKHIVILAGHYEGFDERILEHVDEEVSLGDFVMTGGEIAAAAIMDSIVRLLPGVLKKNEATEQESFFELPIELVIDAVGETQILQDLKKRGVTRIQLLEYPHYTRPSEFGNLKVPDVLMEGNHAAIEKWRVREAYRETCEKRYDLLDKQIE